MSGQQEPEPLPVDVLLHILHREALLREMCRRYGVDFRDLMAASPAREQKGNGL